VNRTVSMANRYLGGERPDPSPAPAAEATFGWSTRVPTLQANLAGCLLHEALATIWAAVGEANRYVDAEKPWELSKAAKAGDATAADRLRIVLGNLVEVCRLIGLAAAPFLPATAPRVLAQLGYPWPYEADGNGGPPLLDELRWGAHAGEAGRLSAPEPLFPRLDTEIARD
jgi:methionyl-tRNA synthetase